MPKPKITHNDGKPAWLTRIGYIALNGIAIECLKNNRSVEELKNLVEHRYNAARAGKIKWGEQ